MYTCLCVYYRNCHSNRYTTNPRSSLQKEPGMCNILYVYSIVLLFSSSPMDHPRLKHAPITVPQSAEDEASHFEHRTVSPLSRSNPW